MTMKRQKQAIAIKDLPRGVTMLQDGMLNKGTAFTEAERDALGLRGLLPPFVHSFDEQVMRFLATLRHHTDPLDKFVALNALHDRNETLFFRVVSENPDEILPFIYTPTVGLACQRFGWIFRRPRGLFISTQDHGRIKELLRNWPHKARLIVVTDGERILGLGDLGANGMGIPVGKLSIYTAGAGVDPSECLPITIDAGTNNESLLADPMYVGLRHKRITGEAYDALIEEFVTAAQEVFPGVLIQFEDFANHNAFRLLDRYKDRICTFNDDIQGTAAVALAGLLSALKVTGGKLADQKVLFMGAGEAATGIANLIVAAIVSEGGDEAAARRCCWLVDSKGLVVKSRTDLAKQKLPFAHEHAPVGDLLGAVKSIKPTAIIGVAAVGGTFTPEVLAEMAKNSARPIVFALSNPTSKSECTAEQAYRGTGGKALFACGSPFDPVTLDGKTFVPRQGNNSYIFPGVGLGVLASRARRVTDAMFMASARTLADMVTAEDLAQGSLYPPLKRIRDVSARIGAAVALVARDAGLAGHAVPDDALAFVREQMYQPVYRDYV